MALIRWSRPSLPDPFAEFERLQDDLSRLFGLAGDDTPGLFDRNFSVPLDVFDAGEEILVRAEVPGIERKDLDLSLNNKVLTLKGEKKVRDEKARLYRDETWSGKFQRTLSLPETVDPDKVSAELKDGLLTIRIGKRAEAQPRQIAVKVQ